MKIITLFVLLLCTHISYAQCSLSVRYETECSESFCGVRIIYSCADTSATQLVCRWIFDDRERITERSLDVAEDTLVISVYTEARGKTIIVNLYAVDTSDTCAQYSFVAKLPTEQAVYPRLLIKGHYLTLSLEEQHVPAAVQIYTVHGIPVLQEKIHTLMTRYALWDIPKGVYIVCIVSRFGETISVKKIVLQ